MFRKIVLALIVAVGLAVVVGLFVDRSRYSHQELRACFNDVQGLQVGAPVRIAGVDVGTVRSVRANPQRKDCPAEIEMDLATTYDIRIPRDSIVAIETSGILGPTYVGIDATRAVDMPIENHGVLKTRQSNPPPSLENLIKALDLTRGLSEASKGVQEDGPKAAQPPSPRQSPGKSKSRPSQPPPS